MNVFLIMPVASDIRYAEKRKILRIEGAASKSELHLPLERSPTQPVSRELIIADLKAADVIVADLSLERPSCYFELGLAQALGKSVTIIAESGTPIHQAFDRDSVSYYGSAEEYSSLIKSILEGRNVGSS